MILARHELSNSLASTAASPERMFLSLFKLFCIRSQRELQVELMASTQS